MQTNYHIDEVFETNKNNTSAWLFLWSEQWNTLSWFFTSVVSSIIASEIYLVIASVYPNFLISTWLSFGFTSAWSLSLLTAISIIGAGIALGSLVYAGSLYYYAKNQIEYEFKPLLNLWTTNNKLYGKLIKPLLNNQYFFEISEFLQSFPGAAPLKEYLKNLKQNQELKKLMKLLLRLWESNTIDQKIKIFTITLISDACNEPNAAERIENIAKMLEICWSKPNLDETTIKNILTHSTLLAPYIEQILNYCDTDFDLLNKLIDEPQLFDYFDSICQNDQSGNVYNAFVSLRALYYYLKYDMDDQEHRNLFENDDFLKGQVQMPSPLIFEMFKSNFIKNKKNFSILWQRLVFHPQLEWIEYLFIELNNNPNYKNLTCNEKICNELLKLFNKPVSHADREGELFQNRISNLMSIPKNFDYVCQLINLMACVGCLKADILEKVLVESYLESSVMLLSIYYEKIWDQSFDEYKVKNHLNNLLVKNNNLHDNLSQVTKTKSIDNKNAFELIIRNHLHENHTKTNIERPKKNKGPFHKLAKEISKRLPSQNNEKVDATNDLTTNINKLGFYQLPSDNGSEDDLSSISSNNQTMSPSAFM